MIKLKRIYGFYFLLISIISITLALSGCVSRKKTILFQNLIKDTVFNIQPTTDYLVQNGDVLYIKVQSLDDKASAFINGNNQVQNFGSSNSEHSLYLTGYEISSNGMLRIPYLDSIKVSGNTTEQIATMITDSLKQYIVDVLVVVKIASFKVSVFGEVHNSGTFVFYKKRPTIFEAIAAAKPTEYYNAKNVVITRYISDNEIRVERLDITSLNVINSPYYYLQPNDQIYIEPLKVKKYGFNTFPYGLILSTISTVMVVISLFNK